jgi:hypothetical protein
VGRSERSRGNSASGAAPLSSIRSARPDGGVDQNKKGDQDVIGSRSSHAPSSHLGSLIAEQMSTLDETEVTCDNVRDSPFVREMASGGHAAMSCRATIPPPTCLSSPASGQGANRYHNDDGTTSGTHCTSDNQLASMTPGRSSSGGASPTHVVKAQRQALDVNERFVNERLRNQDLETTTSKQADEIRKLVVAGDEKDKMKKKLIS